MPIIRAKNPLVSWDFLSRVLKLFSKTETLLYSIYFERVWNAQWIDRFSGLVSQFHLFRMFRVNFSIGFSIVMNKITP